MFPETRVLVIDDNIDLTKIIHIILASEGLTVKVCNDLQEGLFCLLDWKPQLLLLDVNIDGEDAREFCKKIKKEKKEPIKVILMSGDESTLDYKERYGADDCIAKPFDSSLLIKMIAASLGERI